MLANIYKIIILEFIFTKLYTLLAHVLYSNLGYINQTNIDNIAIVTFPYFRVKY